MKKTYINPFMEIFVPDVCDILTVSGVESKASGEGDIVDWLNC